MARILKANGEVLRVDPANGTDFQLQEMYEHVGTDVVEILTFSEYRLVFCEEGKMRNKVPNVLATAVALKLGWTPLDGDVLVGDVLFCKRSEVL